MDIVNKSLPLIAIDGPAGAGKSSTSQAVAKRLGVPFLDTGALYRAAAWAVNKTDVNPLDAAAVARVVEKAAITIVEASKGLLVVVDGVDITTALREPLITKIVGPVCEVPEVRNKLVAMQRCWAERGFGVMEGRDIGTVVLPQARLKVFITARPEVRARRRLKELNLPDESKTIAQLTAEIIERDQRDSQRANSPLKQADDAILLDNSDMIFGEQVDFILRLAARRFEMRLYGV
ncbi:MAG: (d)CMP kinase [Calditrichaeota bacterium]|nr:(d)CMP kinase [Calditrichota bacterium]